MLGTLIGIVVLLIVVGIIWWGIQQLLPLMPMGEPFATIVRVLLVVIMAFVCLYIILQLLGVAGIAVPSIGMGRMR